MKTFLVCQILILFAAASATFAAPPKSYPALESMGLHPQVLKYSYISQPELFSTSKEPLYDLSFGRITEEQYLRLKNYFLNKTKVPYRPKRNYRLTDFLPPQMQALYGLSYESPEHKVTGFRNFLYGDDPYHNGEHLGPDEMTTCSTAFCYGTAWNNIVALQNTDDQMTPFELGHFRADIADDFILNDIYSTRLPARQKPKFGDLLPHYRMTPYGLELVHLPVYLIDGLVFEKEDSFSTTPFRIVSLSETTTSTKALVYKLHKQALFVDKRRPLGLNKPLLPKISDVAVYGSGPNARDAHESFGESMAKRLTMTAEHANNIDSGKLVPSAEVLLPIQFEIDSEGRGVLAYGPQKNYFFRAYSEVYNSRLLADCEESLRIGLNNRK